MDWKGSEKKKIKTKEGEKLFGGKTRKKWKEKGF